MVIEQWPHLVFSRFTICCSCFLKRESSHQLPGATCLLRHSAKSHSTAFGTDDLLRLTRQVATQPQLAYGDGLKSFKTDFKTEENESIFFLILKIFSLMITFLRPIKHFCGKIKLWQVCQWLQKNCRVIIGWKSH